MEFDEIFTDFLHYFYLVPDLERPTSLPQKVTYFHVFVKIFKGDGRNTTETVFTIVIR